ncbi:hypothetical protein Sste5346_008900 [Sporothrix stenoceras]|uniref:Mitochondrial mRNA processing protein n=1 Tax=Sporothrix stenoceras TaxID=5173 RepID=A0ABR3YNH4_9PEZI
MLSQQWSRQYEQQSADLSATETAAAGSSSAPPTTDAGKEAKQTTPRARKSKSASNNTNGSSAGNNLGGRKAMKSTKAAAKAAAQAKAGLGGAASQTQLKLWRETLEVLKKLETAQGRLAEQAAIATGVATEEMLSSGAASPEKGKDGAAPATSDKAAKGKKAIKVHTLEEKQAAVVAAKEAQDQVKMLTSALHLLKTVLSTQGPQQQQQHERKQQEEAQLGQPDRTAKGELPEGKLGKNAKKKLAKKKAEGAAQEEAKEGKDNKATISSSAAASAAASSKKASSSRKKTTGAAPGGPPAPRAIHKLPYRVSSVDSRDLALTPIEENQRPVPKLHYGLDRALFNPGVYHLQDPRSRVYNFDPYLASIMPLQEFDFNALKQYVTSSKDPTLISMAAKHKMKYSGSTSSMTSMLSHFHFLLSGWRPINAAHTTRSFTPESMSFTRITRGPAATFLHWKDGTYAIDADKEFDTANILSMLGKSMEKLLTLSKEDFEKYRVTRSHELTEEERNDPESFHYTTFGDFMMRSQLDAYDARLPGTGMFDLKTRAVVSIRMDAQDFQRGLGYEIRQRFGQWESFEREYFDMIRSAFLKYSLQVRMGRMDGIYVAFHNTQRIFGFQYISINEMDMALHGTEDTALGDREFKLSLHLLNAVLDKATERFPGRSLRLHIETRPSEAAPFMYIFATPVTDKEIAEVQDAGKESVEAFERNILGITAQESNDNDESNSLAESAADDADADAEAEAEAKERWEYDEYDFDDSYSVDVWETMRQKVEETMENEAQGVESVRDTIEDALEQSGLLRGRSPEETRAYVDALLEAITRTDTEAVAETILKGQDADAEVDADVDADAESAAETEAASEVQSDVKAEAEAKEKVLEEAETEGDTEEKAEIETTSSTAEPDINAESVEAGNKTDDEAVIAESADEAISSTSGTSVSTYDLSQSVIDEDGDSNLDKSKSSGRSTTETQAPASSPSGTLSLKDLIIKLAAKVEAAQARDAAASSSSEMSENKQANNKDKDKDGEDDNSPTSESPVLFNYSNSIAELVDAPKNKRFERILSEMMASSKEGKAPTKATATHSTTETPETPEKPEIIGMIMTIRNKVNGRYVVRPEKLNNADSWKVEYAIEEIETKRARTLYDMLKTRRKALLSKDGKDGGKDGKDDKEPEGLGEYVAAAEKKTNAKSAFNREFMNKLYALSAKGRRYRKNENRIMSKRPLHVYGVEGAIEWGEVFADEIDEEGEVIDEQAEEKRKKGETV